MMSRSLARLVLLFQLLVASQCWSAEREAAFPWIEPEGASQAVVLFAGEELPAALRERCVELAGGRELHAVSLSAGNQLKDRIMIDPAQLPGVIAATGFTDEAQRDRFVAVVARQPDHVGLIMEKGAAVVISGRRLVAIGDSPATIMLAASAGRPLWTRELKTGEHHDWTMLRRAAMERRLANFPPQVALPPIVESGALMIVGGGALPTEVVQRFIELAGGYEAPMVVLPIAAEETLPEDESRDTRVLTRAGAKNVKSLRARSRGEVEAPAFAAALREAKGVWFNGGRQWRFVDAYMGTTAEELFRDVLRRGGVIGGSSAGASIQSQYMPRGSPLGNIDMMAEGYERGLGFLPGAAIDQHFTQRRRHADMTRLMRRYPQLLGIGIDEGTALVVRGGIGEIIGAGNVHFYDYRAGPPGGEHDYSAAAAGLKYDLAERRLIDGPR